MAHRRKISRDDGSHHPIIEEEDEEELDSLDLGTNDNDSRRNSRRDLFSSTLPVFDPKRQKCDSPSSEFFRSATPAFESNILQPQPRPATRVRRTSSVDSFHDEFPITRSRKASRASLTPRSVASRNSITEINSKFCFGPIISDDSKSAGTSPMKSIGKSKSCDGNIGEFFSITFDHDKHLSAELPEPRKLAPVDFSFPASSLQQRQQILEPTSERMTPLFQNLSIHP